MLYACWDYVKGWADMFLNQFAGHLESLEGLHMELLVWSREDFISTENIIARGWKWDYFRSVIVFFQQYGLKKELTHVCVKDCAGWNRDTQALSGVIREHLLDFQGRTYAEGSLT